MPTTKAPYRGDGTGRLIQDFSAELRDELRNFYPDKAAVADRTFGHPADAFVNSVLSAAYEHRARLFFLDFDSTKKELHAEQTDLLESLTSAEGKLRKLSRDFDRALGLDADPLGCADKIQDLIKSVNRAGELIGKLPPAKKRLGKQRELLVPLTIDVLRVLKQYDIAPSATADPESDYKSLSPAVKILKAIGDDIGMVRSLVTWRDLVIEAKKAAADLK
jgi:hypothetical protein